jgi:hypothetical protein
MLTKGVLSMNEGRNPVLQGRKECGRRNDSSLCAAQASTG